MDDNIYQVLKSFELALEREQELYAKGSGEARQGGPGSDQADIVHTTLGSILTALQIALEDDQDTQDTHSGAEG